MGFVPSQRGVVLLTLCSIFEAFAILAVGLRLWSRKIKGIKLHINDYAILIALVFSSGLIAAIITGVTVGGLGRHIGSVNQEELVAFGKFYVANIILWSLALTSVKVSIIHLYITIFRNTTFIRCCYAVMAVSVGFGVAGVLEGLLLCRPLAFYWNPFIEHTCGSTRTAYLATQILNMVTDTSVAVLPMPVLWSLKMKASKKLGLSILFGIGFIICVVTVCRIVLVKEVIGVDQTYSAALLCCFTILESQLGIILACLPIVRPAAAKIGESTANTLGRRLMSAGRSSISGNQGLPTPTRVSVDSKKKNFHRLYDNLYPFSSTNNTVSEIGSTRLDDLEAKHMPNNPEIVPSGGIQVTRTWDHHSSSGEQ